jgi:hypothetical protein
MHLEKAEAMITEDRFFGVLRLEPDADARGRDRRLLGESS